MKEHASNYWRAVQQSLSEYWQSFLHILPRLAFAILLLIITLLIASQISRLVSKRLSSKAHDPLFGQFVTNLIKYALIICCVILFLHILGLTGIAGGLLAGAGLTALIFGFAFKDIAENFLAGIILAFDRPFSMDDTVRIGDETGHVKALNFRTTHIKTFNEKDVFIPNSKIIKESVVNLTRDGMIRLDFVIGVAYEDDIEKALSLIIANTANVEGVMSGKKPFAVVEEMAVNTVNIRCFFWSETTDYKKGVLVTKSKVVSKVKQTLVEQGFTLPANILELKVYDKRKAIPVSLLSSSNS